MRQRIAKAKELGIPCGMLDDERKRRQKVVADEKKGLPTEPEPWHEPVSGAQLLNEICVASGDRDKSNARVRQDHLCNPDKRDSSAPAARIERQHRRHI